MKQLLSIMLLFFFIFCKTDSPEAASPRISFELTKTQVPPAVRETFNELVQELGGISEWSGTFPYPAAPTWRKDRSVYHVVFYFTPDGCNIRFVTAAIRANGTLITYASEDPVTCD